MKRKWSDNMEVEIRIDSNLEDDKIILITKNKDEKINNIINLINNTEVVGYKENEKYILNLNDIESFYTEDNKILARTKKEIYSIKKRIYELEEKLKNTRFVRISNSEIVNVNEISKLEYRRGTICLYFKSGNITYVSRRYIKKVKEFILKEVDVLWKDY